MLGEIGEFDLQPNENRGMTPRVFEYLFAKIQKVHFLTNLLVYPNVAQILNAWRLDVYAGGRSAEA